MNLVKTRIHVGAERPFRALHLSDNHLCHADMRDGQRKVDLAKKRHGVFSTDSTTPESLLEEQLSYARENGLTVLYTGDLIDFVSYQNLENAWRRWRASTVS